MKIALLLRSKKQPKTVNDVEQAVVFDVEKDKVVGVENETLQSKDVKELTSWALTRKVKEIYTPQADEQLRNFFSSLGINIRGYDELSDNRLFQTFIL
ncbi:hypothetical protein M2459_000510 [Parabacteroides sp. PF5-5]|uniref:hypothetical protein n=1 Tax=unclassified Parabacteroides TaxID=2649774 RepID=UPI0024763410|nr:MULTISPECIES: hypothetical protein [unclassified Parabacteroides]MDH6303556.1 hypothetical protein [Parabacteroides sp. PH5-39]MDH6314878.1 hypothetical protein [Parabacteroides sp. PF5-13]MDH6318215.1 hypothetical protein [Parabacteroides sp. PH5-13]MDH6321852.1 hypothetical protein [Parabacteroides sp. PH5-8]MDH6325976.1 hypothetical protein [Parabacteroides sp. PH5-41]